MQGGIVMIFNGNESVCGTTTKGDVYITLELTARDGIKIEVVSKVIEKYGDSIRESVIEVLHEFGIDNANVLVEDYGALDFVIRARTETAAQRILAQREGQA